MSQHNKKHSMVIVGVCSRKSIEFPEDLLIYFLTNLWQDWYYNKKDRQYASMSHF